MGDIVIAVGKGHRKKDAKVHTYEEAFKNLITKPLQEIMQGIDVEEEAKNEEEANGSGVSVIMDGKKMSVSEKMDKMIQRLKDAVYKENNINTVDACATNLGLTKTCIYRKLQGNEEGDASRIACDLYLEKFLIASGEGEKRKEAQIDAYNNAWEVLITTTGEHIVKDHKRLTNDNDDPSIIDVHVKGDIFFCISLFMINAVVEKLNFEFAHTLILLSSIFLLKKKKTNLKVTCRCCQIKIFIYFILIFINSFFI